MISVFTFPCLPRSLAYPLTNSIPMKPIIRVENLSKQYRIGASRKRHDTLRDALTSAVRGIGDRFRSNGRNDENTIWALKDVSFDVQPGEVIGIIGRNGAGKSTLLKILSRVTEPTSGEIVLYGRVASLLEVGTGFHPELTGRDNIYLNGAILGMKHTEIGRKFDEIVDFAEIEQFIDTPVKHYSSGMYTRLAFAVAANLDPDILIVDEVLSVGDAVFQKKCLGKIGDVSRGGRTVFFVSHNLGAVRQLCSRVIGLSNGERVIDSDPGIAIANYVQEANISQGQVTFEIEEKKNTQILALSTVSITGDIIKNIPHSESFVIEIEYEVRQWTPGSLMSIDILDDMDSRIIWSSDVSTLVDMSRIRRSGRYRARATVPGHLLVPGRYYITTAIWTPGKWEIDDIRDKAMSIDIFDAGSILSHFGIRHTAVVMVPLSWDVEYIQD